MTRLLFARHGNTFDPGDKVVWVGRETDLPLVAKGLVQAAQLAAALERKGWIPDAIYCASLKRTRRTAEIVAETLGLPAPIVDGRLDELDYGSWAGRSNDEILAADPHAATAMDAWNQRDEWPEGAGWVSRKDQVLADLKSFADDRLAAHQRPLVVSSNGTLRFLPRFLLSGNEHPSSFKMRTGHLGIIERRNESMVLTGWDLPPETV